MTLLLLSPRHVTIGGGGGGGDDGGGDVTPPDPGDPGLFAAPISAGVVPQYLPESPRLAKLLMRHYAAGSQGRNVYLLNDFTVTENDPDGTFVTWADVAHVWYGGHAAEFVDATTSGALQAAGYTVEALP